MTSGLSEEEMRRALFGDAEPAPLVTPPPVPEATAELVFEKPKASLQKKKVAKAFTPRLQVTLMVGNEYEGKMFELIHQADTLSKLLAEQQAVKAARKKFRYVEVVEVKSETIESKPEAIPELSRVSKLANQAGERFADSLMPVLRHLVRNASLTPEHRSEMLTQCIPGMKWPDVSAALALLDDEDFKTVNNRVKKIQVKNTETNWTLVSAMKSQGYLATLTRENDKIKATTRPSSMVDEGGWL